MLLDYTANEVRGKTKGTGVRVLLITFLFFLS
jgi:hypothetical protein